MTLGELAAKISEIIAENPESKDARILIDTEARCFNTHMVDVDSVWFQSEDTGVGPFVGINLDTSRTTFQN